MLRNMHKQAGVRAARDALGLSTHVLKVAELIDLSDVEERKRFDKFLKRKDVYGHKTHNIESVMQQGSLLSALEALRLGKLKSYESGFTAGAHEEVARGTLSPQELSVLDNKLLQAVPDMSALGDNPEDTMRQYLQARYTKVKSFLKGRKDAEKLRKDVFSVSKLSPNIFLTHQGLLSEPGYGDSAVLIANHSAKRSPYTNYLTDEYVIPPKAVLVPRRAAIGKGYVIVPRSKSKALLEEYPATKFIVAEDIPADTQDKLYKPTHSFSEVFTRWLPQALRGNLIVGQTR